MIISPLSKKLNKTSFNSLSKLKIDWKSLICNNKELAKKYKNYSEIKSKYVMVQLDYKQLEIYVLASLSKDANLIRAVNSSLDCHNENTKTVYGIDYLEIKRKLSEAKENKNLSDELHYQMLWDDFYQKRKFTKALSFSLSYGASANKISHDLHITLPESEKLISDFYKAYPGLKSWQGQTLLKAIQFGYLETPFGRKRATPGLIGRHEAFPAFIKEDFKTIIRLRKAGEYWNLRNDFKTVLNSNVQSTASDMCSIAAIKVNKLFKKRPELLAKLYFWVHDSILFHVHIDNAIECIKLVTDIMENQVKYKGDPVNYQVEPEIGFSYEYMSKLDRDHIINDTLTKEMLLEKLDKSLDDDINKKFRLIVKATSTEMNDLPTYIKAMKEAKSDYFDAMVEKMGLGVSTPDQYMSMMNEATLTEYLEAIDFTADLEEEDYE